MQRAFRVAGVVIGFVGSAGPALGQTHPAEGTPPGAPPAPPEGGGTVSQAPPVDSPDPPALPPEPPPAPAPAPPAATPPSTPESQASPRLAPEIHVDSGTAPSEGSVRRPRGLVGIEVDLGMNVRLGDAAGFDRDESVGAMYGASVWLNAFEAVALGLELQHVELGRAAAQSAQNVTDVEFSSTAGWLAGRIVPLRARWGEGFVALRAGLALQHVDAHGVRQTGTLLEPAASFSCTEIDGPALAFGGGLGARLGVGKGLSLVSRLDATAQRLSSDVVGGCAVGVGSTTSVSFGLGLLYEVGSSSDAATASRRARHTW